MGQTSVGYPENSDGQVATYSATDPDNDQHWHWSLSGDDAGDFSISNTGELTFQTAPDHEAPADDNTDNRYELTVEASDGSVKGTLDVLLGNCHRRERTAGVLRGDCFPHHRRRTPRRVWPASADPE